MIEISRRQRKRQAIHQTMLDAAESLFAEHGVTRTTMDQIAEAADVARQTVFNHFPYKEALAVELAADNIRIVAERAHVLLEAGTPALEVLERAASWVLDKAIEQGELAGIVARELLHADQERASHAADRVPLCELLEAILVQAREEGSIRGDLPLSIVAKRISAIVTGIVAQVMSTDAADARRNLTVCFDILFHGILERRT